MEFSKTFDSLPVWVVVIKMLNSDNCALLTEITDDPYFTLSAGNYSICDFSLGVTTVNNYITKL